MAEKITLSLSPMEAAQQDIYITRAAAQMGISRDEITLARVVKRSIDARQRRIKVNMTLEIYLSEAEQPDPIHFEYGDVTHAPEVVIVGAGPSGLFAALTLIELGIKPIVLERGYEVSERKRHIAQINRNGEVNPDSNYSFGEGGAGTFSDGKLYTRSKKRGNWRKALEVLHFHGAAEDILYDAHPHIGTDKLPRIMTRMRETILRAGGEYHFNSRMSDILIKDSVAKGVYCGDQLYTGAAVILATGHSARDIYELLHKKGVAIESKPFAMGVRIEHPQELIDSIQYHGEERGEWLPAASYSLVSQVAGRGVYSFCMCPGGFIVPAMTSDGECVVNGMSPSNRGSKFANSGLVTEIRLEDFAHLREEWGELAGLRFQQELELAAAANGGDAQVAPAQTIADFVAGRASKSLPSTSYIPGLQNSRLDEWMPPVIAESLRGGIADFGRKMRGFVTSQGIVAGVESRTSSPIRIPRDPATLQHPQIGALYPTGEGAGYAGGIISAALDGERIALAVAQEIK